MDNTFMVDNSAQNDLIAKLGLDPNSADTKKELDMRKIAAGLPMTATIPELIKAEKLAGRYGDDSQE